MPVFGRNVVAGYNVRGGTEPPSPLTIFGDNLDTWLRADVGITETDGYVSEWADVLSGNGRTFSATGGSDPFVIDTDSDFGGKSSVSFNGDDQYLVSDDAASDWRFMQDGTGSYAWICVYIDPAETGTVKPFMATGGNAVSTHFRIMFDYTNARARSSYANGVELQVLLNEATSTSPANAVYQFSTAYKYLRSPHEAEFWSAATSRDTADGSSAPDTGDPGDALHIGSYISGTAPTLCKIREIVIAKTFPSDEQVIRMNTYSENKGYF